MQCRNCGAVVRSNDSICQVCGVSVNMSPNAVIEEISNPVTNEFMSPSGAHQQMPINPALLGGIPEIEEKPSEEKYESKDGNDRATATAMNFVTFAIITGVFIAICIFLITTVFK